MRMSLTSPYSVSMYSRANSSRLFRGVEAEGLPQGLHLGAGRRLRRWWQGEHSARAVGCSSTATGGAMGVGRLIDLRDLLEGFEGDLPLAAEGDRVQIVLPDLHRVGQKPAVVAGDAATPAAAAAIVVAAARTGPHRQDQPDRSRHNHAPARSAHPPRPGHDAPFCSALRGAPWCAGYMHPDGRVNFRGHVGDRSISPPNYPRLRRRHVGEARRGQVNSSTQPSPSEDGGDGRPDHLAGHFRRVVFASECCECFPPNASSECLRMLPGRFRRTFSPPNASRTFSRDVFAGRFRGWLSSQGPSGTTMNGATVGMVEKVIEWDFDAVEGDCRGDGTPPPLTAGAALGISAQALPSVPHGSVARHGSVASGPLRQRPSALLGIAHPALLGIAHPALPAALPANGHVRRDRLRWWRRCDPGCCCWRSGTAGADLQRQLRRRG